jgi:hypothetical protein
MSDQTPPRPGRRATDVASSDSADLQAGLPARAAGVAVHGAGAFEAQLFTQGTIKRGLRGGKEVLDAARTSYLKAEWSGPADRRPRKGLVTKTKI